MADVRVGDIGTEVVVQVLDEDLAAVDVSAATVRTIYLRRPSGTVLTKAAVLDTTGADGRIRHDSVAGDFSEAGYYRVFGRVVLADGRTWSTDEGGFQVRANFA